MIGTKHYLSLKGKWKMITSEALVTEIFRYVSEKDMSMATFMENMEPLLAAAELYAEVHESWEAMTERGKTEQIDEEVWNKAIEEKFQAVDVLLAAAVTYAKWGKNVPRPE